MSQSARNTGRGPASAQGPGPLAGLRVVDFGQWLAGPLLAMWLADAGADVIRVDPPGGPRWDHPVNAALQRGKRSIVLDLKRSDDAARARELIRRADIVIEGFRPGVMARLGLGFDDVAAENPRLIYVSLPGFGESDPRMALPGWEGVVTAAAGIYLYPGCTPMDYIGDRSAEPIFSAVPVASSYGAFVAAHSLMAALIARERDGRGQRIETPLYDACFELIASGVMKMENPPSSSSGPRMTMALPQVGHYQCADGGWLELCLFQDKHLEWFAKAFLPPEYIEDGMGDADRMLTDTALQERARARYAELFASLPAREWEIKINEESGASAALCQTSEEWLTVDTHARDSGAVVEVDDPILGLTAQAGFPFNLSVTPMAVSFPRRELDADRDAILSELDRPYDAPELPAVAEVVTPPLQGLRLLDVAQVLAGPTVGRVLAEYGLEVVKIHSFADRQLGMHVYTNSGKQSIMLDLKTAEGMDVFRELATGVDFFVQNFTRGVADRIGLGEEALRSLSPEVIYVSISAFGHRGYRGGWRGREQLGQGPTGMQVRLGDVEPVMAPYPYNDYGSGNLAAFGALVAYFHRLRTGAGQHVETSLTHSGTFLQLPFMVAHEGRMWDEPHGQRAKGWSSSSRLYEAADGWLYVHAQDGFDAVPELAGESELQLQDTFRGRLVAEWVDALSHAGIGAHRLVDQPDLMEDPIVRQRGLAIVREHPGIGRITMAGPSPRLSRTPAKPTRAAGPPGSDTRAVLAALGRDADELLAKDVVRDGLPKGSTLVGMFR